VLSLTENARKIVHFSAVLVPFFCELTSKTVILTALSIITIAYILQEALRLEGQPLPIITRFTLKLSRPEERTSVIIRPAYLAIGIILTLILFPSTIAYSSIWIGAIGDPVAAIIGRRIGRKRIIRRKTVEGFVAGLAASFLAASLLLSPFIALIGAGGAMFMELLDVPDDNLTMPVVAGALMTIATLALHT